jgi:hypothetical protein
VGQQRPAKYFLASFQALPCEYLQLFTCAILFYLTHSVIGISVVIHQYLLQKNATTVLKDNGRMPVSENESIALDLLDPDSRHDSDNVRGRLLRRQTGSPTQKLTDDANGTLSVGSNKVSSTSRKREGTVSPDTSNSNNTSEQDFDRQGHDPKSKKTRKTVTFDSAEPNVAATNSESDTSNNKRLRTAAQLAREQRSQRRQAAQGTDGSESSLGVSSVARKSDSRSTHKKKVPGSSMNNTETDANVVRVPMRTGTLVLYRGSHPRAVFIRRV